MTLSRRLCDDEKAIRRWLDEWGREGRGGQLLMALRAGRMTLDQLNDRLVGDAHSVRYRAMNLGYVAFADGYATLTELGRRVCPLRAG